MDRGETRPWAVRLVRVTVAILLGATALSATGVTVVGWTPPTGTTAPSVGVDVTVAPAPTDQTTTAAKSPNVSSTLLQLVDADDRAAFASAHGIDLRDGRVVVVVELRGRSTVPDGYDVTVQQTATVDGETFVQALVPVDDVVPLAADPGVTYVRLPDRADAGGQNDAKDGQSGTETTPGQPGKSSTRRTDVLVVVVAISIAVVTVGLYGWTR